MSNTHGQEDPSRRHPIGPDLSGLDSAESMEVLREYFVNTGQQFLDKLKAMMSIVQHDINQYRSLPELMPSEQAGHDAALRLRAHLTRIYDEQHKWLDERKAALFDAVLEDGIDKALKEAFDAVKRACG